MAQFLQKFLVKYDKLDIELSTGRSFDIQKRLEAGDLDLILIIEPRPSPSIEIEIFGTDSFKFYQTTKTKKVYSSPALAPLIVMPTASAGVQNLKENLKLTELNDRKIYTTSSLESAKELALNGVGIGLLPQAVAKSSVESNKLEEVKLKGISAGGIGKHNIGIAYHSIRKDSVIINTLVNEIKGFGF